MPGSFLDTTVVVHMAEPNDPNRAKAELFVAGHQPAHAPFYALHELLEGRIRLLCDAHNTLLGSASMGEAMLGLLARSPKEGRKREARQKALAAVLQQLESQAPNQPRGTIARDGLEALALLISRLWLRARNMRNVSLVQPLGCFSDGDLSYGDAGELRGPSGSFTCSPTERCAAAAYLHEDKAALKKLVESLHPSNLPEAVASKNETSQRKQALKHLQQEGPVKFNKRKCRALGDAYFAAMCPPGSVVATSNLEDHAPLCTALSKLAKSI